MDKREELEKLFKRGYDHGVSGGISEDGETYACDDTEAALNKIENDKMKKLWVDTCEKMAKSNQAKAEIRKKVRGL